MLFDILRINAKITKSSLEQNSGEDASWDKLVADLRYDKDFLQLKPSRESEISLRSFGVTLLISAMR